jgi:two-component system, NtrC family, nitrogen regulation sensor histidine kinase NtrY
VSAHTENAESTTGETAPAQPAAERPAPSRPHHHWVHLRHDSAIVILALAAGFPAVLVCLILLWRGDITPKVQWTLTVLVVSCWLGFSFALRTRVVVPLQTISNLLAALREGDFSIRARGADPEDTLGGVALEVNALSATLREQRLGALEATKLLTKVMEEIDVAVFAFDHESNLRLVNRAGERLLGQPAERIRGRTAAELGLADCLQGEESRLVEFALTATAGRWEIRRTTFRQAGLPHQLLVMSDLSRALREEERKAWKRLIRVLGHELNNSLTPIKSIAASLDNLLLKEPRPDDWLEDMHRGLAVIGNRGEALSRFMEGYSRLAQLPPPRRQPMDVGSWIRRVVRIETRLKVRCVEGPPLSIEADGDQLDQLLINLLRNAADAVQSTGGGVETGWGKSASHLEVWVDDEGPGLSNTANLFVPFFTTKPHGSGIGLVLCRQIAEAHGGSLVLANRANSPGCRALLRVPL